MNRSFSLVSKGISCYANGKKFVNNLSLLRQITASNTFNFANTHKLLKKDTASFSTSKHGHGQEHSHKQNHHHGDPIK